MMASSGVKLCCIHAYAARVALTSSFIQTLTVGFGVAPNQSHEVGVADFNRR